MGDVHVTTKAKNVALPQIKDTALYEVNPHVDPNIIYGNNRFEGVDIFNRFSKSCRKLIQ